MDVCSSVPLSQQQDSSKCMRWLWWQIRTKARNTTIRIKASATKSMMQLSEVKPLHEMKTESVQADTHSAFMPTFGVLGNLC